MDNTNPADWTDAEIARWMAEREGWRVVQLGNYWMLYEPGKDGAGWIHHSSTESELVTCLVEECEVNYPHSLDAAVGWLGRMGLDWARYSGARSQSWIFVSEFTCYETPTCPTSRALCNAGAAAWLAREAGDELH
jgi:hypothetical protein